MKTQVILILLLCLIFPFLVSFVFTAGNHRPKQAADKTSPAAYVRRQEPPLHSKEYKEPQIIRNVIPDRIFPKTKQMNFWIL
jgi:hypothetical protein